MNSLLKLSLCMVMVMGAACSKPAVTSPEKIFIFTSSYAAPPVDRASERYSEFKYELRKAGEKEFHTHLPKSVSANLDGSVYVVFKIMTTEPSYDEKYEYRTSYRLDGKLHQDDIKEVIFTTPSKYQ